MRLQEFWRVMDQVFGPAYARSVAADQVIAALGGRTAQQALDDGYEPKMVWDAICDMADLGPEVRWSYRDEPKRKRHTRG